MRLHRSVFLRIHKTTPLKITTYRLCFRTDLSLLPHTPLPLPFRFFAVSISECTYSGYSASPPP
ncbi:hypothetical protein Bca4012_049747 [Brassica carinata]|uniref:Uncharacterized protein n=3 Tax=Brassica TaxID=3705 RepID=A0A0D3AP58_BRAOL|nr:unnamed protein product [Brassica napus]VDD22388.1 unnamed protein product [Brassica oleracea]